MKWIAKYMIDPGDGIVSVTEFEHVSNDICEVVADAMNGDIKNSDGDSIIDGWIFSLEAVPT